ncbi:hypothetical protein J4E91_001018 [Alternaria rosae]|nr:hypothetical protein J4E91_001018 [Alternaria rosae]
MSLVQFMDMLKEWMAGWNCDEQGLGKTLQNAGLIWLLKVLHQMDNSISESRKDTTTGKRKHCSKDDPVSFCQLLADSVQVSTELSHGALGISQQAVHGHLYGGIYDTSLGEEVEYLCDKKSPFKLTPIICHGEALNSGGTTNILSTNKRAGSKFDAAIDISEFSCDQYGDFEGAVSAYVLITAPKNITKQVKTPLGSGANFQLHVVDESHKSKGQGSGFAKTLRSSTSSKEDMIGCQLEGGKLNIQDRQAEFLFLIGTTFTEPKDLAPFWTIAQIQVRVLLPRWEREKKAYDLKRMHSDHMELLGFDIKLAVHQTNAKPSKPSKTRENSLDVFGHLLTLISI